tara:strand:- start:733 stop:1341 length:609 start_codon:yes stop_codon:yes gene_type:complete
MDIYVINLERRPDRLLKFQNQAKLAGVKAKVMNAVDGKSLSTRDFWIEKYYNLVEKRYLKKGEIGSYISHYNCFEDSTTNKVMVFEDDAKLPMGFWYSYNEVCKTLPSDFDIALLGTTKLWQRKYKEKCELIWENDLWAKYSGDIYGLQAYVITRKAINHLQDCKYPIDSPNDIKFNNVGLNVYILKKDLVTTNRLGSDAQH